MPKLQPPFDQMITGPFVKASHLVAGDFDLKGSDPKGFARIAFVEGNRPIIAAIAAEGGRLLREHLNSQAGGGLSTKSVFR